MLKVLYLSLGDQKYTAEAFRRAGIDLTVFDFWSCHNTLGRSETARIFLEHVTQIKPDLVHMQLQFNDCIDPETIVKAREASPKTIFTNWSGDICKMPVPYFVNISNVVDYSFLSNRGQIPAYLAAGGKNILYWQIGYDQYNHIMPLNKTNFQYKVVFTANYYPDSLYPDAKLRSDIMGVLRGSFGDKAGLFGKGYSPALKIYPVPPSRLSEIYNDSVCVLSVSNFNDVEDYFSDRLLYCIGSGRPTIAYRFPGIEKYFENGKDVLVASNINDIIGLVNRLNNDYELANAVGNNGSRRCLAEHTFDVRVSELLSIIGLSGKL